NPSFPWYPHLRPLRAHAYSHDNCHFWSIPSRLGGGLGQNSGELTRLKGGDCSYKGTRKATSGFRMGSDRKSAFTCWKMACEARARWGLRPSGNSSGEKVTGAPQTRPHP